jgi:uncharacterized protein DUF4112
VDVEVLPPDETGNSKVRQSDSVARIVALLMDDLLRVPGTRMRFGLNPILDLIPGIGDGTAAVVSAMTLFTAVRHRVPKIVITRMALNIVVNAVIGVIPGIGEAFAFWFRPSHRNYKLLQKHMAAAGTVQPPSTRSDKLFVIAILSVVFVLFIGSVLVGGYISFLVARSIFAKP